MAPFFVVSIDTQRVITPKISLESFVEQAKDLNTLILALLGRQNNKQLLMAIMNNIILKKHIDLRGISDFFQKVNSIYKQAGMERAFVKKMIAEQTQGTHYEQLPIFDKANMMSWQFYEVEKTIHNQIKLQRLHPNTGFPATCLNAFLTESAPSSRVLTGECIVFQNEAIELFKEMMNESPVPYDKQRGGSLRPLYVASVIMEFVRSLFDNGIPLQQSLQTLLLGYLIDTSEVTKIHQLLQFGVLNDTPELAKALVNMGSRSFSKDLTYEPAF